MSTLQEQAEAMLETIDTTENGKKHARLKPHDRALIFRLAAKGNINQTEIAKAVGCGPATVSRTLRLLDTRKEARTILESGAAKLADTVVNTDDAGIALKALGKLDVVREDKEGDQTIGPVTIVGGPRIEFVAFQPGDRIVVSPVPTFGGPPEFGVIRKVGAATRFIPLPRDVQCDNLPPDVTAN